MTERQLTKTRKVKGAQQEVFRKMAEKQQQDENDEKLPERRQTRKRKECN